MQTAERWADDREFDRRRIDVGEVDLHCVVAGDAGEPLVVLLHGFPEFWYAWRNQFEPLAAEFRVVAPDLRGYNLSDRPRGVDAYGLARLRDDVVGIVDAFDCESAHLVGHDWGGMIAQRVALRHPDVVDRLVVANAPYPGRWSAQASPGQALRGWYAALFQLPALPERLIGARDDAFLRRSLRSQATVEGAFTDAEVDRYRAAWDRPGALGAMLHYYRALRRDGLGEMAGGAGGSWRDGRRIRAPTMVLWGDRDPALGASVREFLVRQVEPGRIDRFPGASHWLHAEYPERVTEALLSFLSDPE
jgi:pimeloyl-ACP methyl ester carboxylesterase